MAEIPKQPPDGKVFLKGSFIETDALRIELTIRSLYCIGVL